MFYTVTRVPAVPEHTACGAVATARWATGDWNCLTPWRQKTRLRCSCGDEVLFSHGFIQRPFQVYNNDCSDSLFYISPSVGVPSLCPAPLCPLFCPLCPLFCFKFLSFLQALESLQWTFNTLYFKVLKQIYIKCLFYFLEKWVATLLGSEGKDEVDLPEWV